MRSQGLRGIPQVRVEIAGSLPIWNGDDRWPTYPHQVWRATTDNKDRGPRRPQDASATHLIATISSTVTNSASGGAGFVFTSMGAAERDESAGALRILIACGLHLQL